MKICPICKTPTPNHAQNCWLGYVFGFFNKKGIQISLFCLHIAAILITFFCVYIFILSIQIDALDDASEVVFSSIIRLIFYFALAALNEVVARAIKKRKFWGWIVGIIIFGLYIPSLLLPIGVLGLWALLTPDSRRAFGINLTQSNKSREEDSKP